jgi:pSer/pThr/pTyr-binding forkhead associated (FHA) protein
MPELILRSGKRSGRRITLPGGEVVIGRDEGCRIRLTSSDVSRRHCLLRCDGEEITAADLGSRNGTYVNDAAITSPTLLRPGDLLRVGPFLFQVPSAADDGSSDEDISGWLTEEGTEAGGPPPNLKNDTTLMPEMEAKSGDTTELKLAPAGTAGRMASEPPVPPADPVVTQAAAVIREYWASKKSRR